MTHKAVPVDASEALTSVEALAAGIAREAEALDASLDRAFAALRDIRTGLSRIASPPAGDDPRPNDWDPVPPEVARYLAESLHGIAGQLHEALNHAGAPPEKDAAARRAADQLAIAASVLPEEFAALEGRGAADVTEVLERCREDVTTLARRANAPVAKLMGIMQLRDNMDQRTAHVIKGCTLASQQPSGSAKLLEVFLAAQVADMADSVRTGGGIAGTAAGTMLDLGFQARTGVLMAVLSHLMPRTGDALQAARALAPEWAGFGGLSDVSEDFVVFLAGPLTEATIPLAHGLVALSGDGGALRLTHFLDCIDSIMAAARSLEVEAGAMAQSAFAIDGLADGLPAVEALSGDILDDKDSGLEELWATYTVDAEREVHANLVRRFG